MPASAPSALDVDLRALGGDSCDLHSNHTGLEPKIGRHAWKAYLPAWNVPVIDAGKGARTLTRVMHTRP